MAGDKIEQAKEALKYCINRLDARDRFNLITFSTETKRFGKKLMNANEFRKEVLNYIDEIEAKGGTNIRMGGLFHPSGVDGRGRQATG